MSPRAWLAAISLFLLNAGLFWKIALPGVTPYRGSIERGYAYMGKIFAANPDYLSWNPIQYCGIPMHYVYLPLLPYLDALLLRLTPFDDPTYVHRAVCAIALFLGPAAIFMMVREWTGNGKLSYASALAVTLISPLYALIRVIDNDRGLMAIPWRMQVLIKYGEGPHSVGIVLLLLAVIAVLRAGRSRTRGSLIAAAALLAATVLTNWVAGLALAFCVLMLLAVHAKDADFSVKRVIAAGLIGYGFACFWLTPSFVAQMAYNWPQDAFGFQFQQTERLSMIAWVAALLAIRFALRWFPENKYLCWVLLCAFGFGYPVTIFYRFGINPFPESRRYALEYEIFLLLLAVELLRLLLKLRGTYTRIAVRLATLAMLLAITPHIKHHVSHGFEKWKLVPKEETPEYRVAAALNALQPQGRVFVSGGTRFKLNSWFSIPQTGGVFETGLKTRVALHVAYQVRSDLGYTPGNEANESVLMLRALGVEYVVIHGEGSEEYYRDFKNPDKFEGVLEKVWSEKGDTIYRITPFRYAHLVRKEEIPTITIMYGYFKPWIPYVGAMMDPARPALQFEWKNARHARLTGKFPAGMHVAFAIPWDPNWRAYQDGKPVAVRANSTGLMVSEALTAESDSLDLRFEPSFEEYGCAAISLLTLLGSLRYLVRKRA